MKRLLAALAALLFALPATASVETETGRTDGPILFKTIITSFNCTDSFDTPAVTSTVDVTDLNAIDTLPEAVDVLENLHDAVQTSGSADGWCDDKPYVIAGHGWTPNPVRSIFIGPFWVPPSGFRFAWDFGSTPTSYELRWVMRDPFDPVNLSLPFWTSGSSTDFNINNANVGPLEHSSFWGTGPTVLFPGEPIYLRIILNGGTLVDLHSAIIPYYSRAHGDDR